MPLLPEFRARFPKVTIEMNISNRNVDLFDEGYDLAIRLGELKDSGLIARRLEDASLGIFASPAYLKRHGTPRHLDDLDRHQLIQFVMPTTRRPMPWLLRRETEDIEFRFDSALRIHEDVIGAVNLARAGGGLFQIYRFIADEHVRNGELVEVLKSVSGRTRPFSVIYPRNRHLSARVRAFVDFLFERCGR